MKKASDRYCGHRRRGCAPYSGPVERREGRRDDYEEERIVGYDVKYRCDGRVYRTRMDPGSRVPVNVAAAEQ